MHQTELLSANSLPCANTRIVSFVQYAKKECTSCLYFDPSDLFVNSKVEPRFTTLKLVTLKLNQLSHLTTDSLMNS